MRPHFRNLVGCSLSVWIGVLAPVNASMERLPYPENGPLTVIQVIVDSTAPSQSCPSDLTYLQAEMEELLQFVNSSLIRDTLRASLQASIPEAIAQMESIPSQIAFLRKEIIHQELERSHAEEVAREEQDDPSKTLLPCARGTESSYCYAVDQYYAATAANLANQGFLDALECYHRSREH